MWKNQFCIYIDTCHWLLGKLISSPMVYPGAVLVPKGQDIPRCLHISRVEEVVARLGLHHLPLLFVLQIS